MMISMKKIKIFFIYLVSFIYLELLFKVLVHNDIFNISLINILIFLTFFSLLLWVISTIFKKEKINKIIFYFILLSITIWFGVEYVVDGYFGFYVSLSALKIADQVGDFALTGLIEILKRILGIILILLPLILSGIFHKHIDFEHNNWKKNLGYFCLSLLVFLLFILSLNINKEEINSPYYLYYDINNVSLNIDYFGLIHAMIIDLKREVIGFQDKIVNDNPLNDPNEQDDEPSVKVYDYNNLDIDFEFLKENEKNSSIKQIHEYMANDTGTLQNDYTGIFKDKNLILFMAESFNEIAVREDITPTLYKLVNSGFSFKNFYTPTIYSTIGGEFQELSGLYATSTNILSKFRSGNISFPQGIANKFKEINYNTYAYHNNTYTFQDRNKYLKSMGFDNFLGCGNGLEKRVNCKVWPRSDVEMIDTTVDDYINDDHFMVFYATVSGHSGYSWSENYQARKHKEEFLQFNLGLSERISGYLASQMELDQALSLLIQKLDEAGKLEDTVIALVGDHNPYVLDLDEINEASTFEREEIITRNKSSFILWNSEMDTVNVTKVGSQLDVIPTIYNAFGINYDSRLFIGKDILSTEGGLAIFADNSWVSDKGMYYAKSNKFIPVEGEIIPDDYVKNVNHIVNSKVNISKLIIDNNYYQKVFKNN